MVTQSGFLRPGTTAPLFWVFPKSDRADIDWWHPPAGDHACGAEVPALNIDSRCLRPANIQAMTVEFVDGSTYAWLCFEKF
jgi:hypothetical protein